MRLSSPYKIEIGNTGYLSRALKNADKIPGEVVSVSSKGDEIVVKNGIQYFYMDWNPDIGAFREERHNEHYLFLPP